MRLEEILDRQDVSADVKEAIRNHLTEYQQTMTTLKESEEKYRDLVERANDGIAIVQDSLIKYVNPSLSKMTGYTAEELNDTPIMNYIHPDVLSEVIDRYERRMAGQSVPPIYETKILLKNGRTLEIEINASVVTYQGKPADFAILREISERKQAEQSLRESEEKYRTILASIEDGYYEVDLLGNLSFCNDAMCKIHGYSKDEFIGMNNRDYTDEDTASMVYKIFHKVYQTGEPTKIFAYEIIKKDGTRRINEASVSLMTNSAGEPTGFRGIVRDITESRQVEQALRESEARYRRLIELSPDAITLTDLEFNIIAVNQQAVKMSGANIAEEIIGKNAIELIVPEDRNLAIENAQKTLQDGMIANLEYRLLKLDGTIYPAELSAALITDKEDDPFAFISITRDITERKKTEKTMKESENKFRVISERTMMGVCILQDEVIKYANQAFADIFEYSIEEILNWKPGESAKVIHPDDRAFVTEQGRKKQLGEKDIITNYSYRAITKTGKLRWVDNYSKTILYIGKTANLVTLIDITERKQAEEALRESKEKYQMLVEKMQEGVLLEDAKGVLSFVNPRTAELLGYTEDELLGKHWSYLVPKEYLDQVKVETKKRPKGISSTYEAYVLAKDGHYIPVIITATPIFSNGDFDGVLAVFTDITERKLAEKKLRESAEKYRTILETIEEGYYEVDIAGNFSFFNDSLCKILGYPRTELLGMNYRQYMDEETAKRVYQTYNTVFRTGEPAILFDFGFIKKDGTRRASEASISPMRNSAGEIVGFRGITRDVTERTEMAKALDVEREKYQMLVEKLEEGVTLEDPEGFITFANPKTLETLGYTEDELLGKHWSFIVPESDLEQSYFETAKRSKGISSIYESRLLAKDSTIIPVIVTATPIFSSTGEFQGVLVLSTDITDRKRVEEELQQSEEKYSNLFHYSNDAIFLHDLEGNIIDVNQKTLSLFGYTKPQIILIKIPDLHPPESIELSKWAFDSISKEGFVNFEIDFKKKNGEVFPAEVSSSLFDIRGKKVIQGIVRDITERKRAEQALLQVKLEEERYHAMMSHFINNDMQKIINNLELVSLMYESKLEIDSNIVNNVINIASGSSKTIDTVNKIFAVLQSPFIQPKDSFHLMDIIDEIIAELSNFSQLININKESLSVMTFADVHFKDVFKEILLFILSFYHDPETYETRIDIEGSFLPSSFCVLISDCCSEPLSHEIISKLSGQIRITNEWEIIGHNIGIALASVIMQYYGGSLEIRSVDPKGNEFQLLFPLNLIKAPEEIKIN